MLVWLQTGDLGLWEVVPDFVNCHLLLTEPNQSSLQGSVPLLEYQVLTQTESQKGAPGPGL